MVPESLGYYPEEFRLGNKMKGGRHSASTEPETNRRHLLSAKVGECLGLASRGSAVIHQEICKIHI